MPHERGLPFQPASPNDLPSGFPVECQGAEGLADDEDGHNRAEEPSFDTDDCAAGGDGDGINDGDDVALGSDPYDAGLGGRSGFDGSISAVLWRAWEVGARLASE